MAITSKGTGSVWDLKEAKALGPSFRLTDLSQSRPFISFSALTSTGLPIIGSRSGKLYTHDRDLLHWTILVESDGAIDLQGLPPHDLVRPNGSESSLFAAVVLSSESHFYLCFKELTQKLRDGKSLVKAHELCEELWTGRLSGILSGNSDFNGKMSITRRDRLKLLQQTIDSLSDVVDFQPLCNEYAVLLRHTDLD